MRHGTLTVLLLGATTCRTPPYDLIARSDGAAPTAFDLAAPAPGCSTHRLEAARLVELVKLDGPGTPTQGAALRVRLGVMLRAGCDVLGSIDVKESIGDTVSGADITAMVWRGVGNGVCGGPRTVSRVLTLPSNFNVFVRDAAPGGTLALTFTEGTAIDGFCGYEDACYLDCQCRLVTGLEACVYTGEIAGVCGSSCSEDVDCPAVIQQPHCDPYGIPAYLCRARPTDGVCDPPCPFGQVCDNGVCAPQGGRPITGVCRCDDDCGAGRLCNADTGSCIIPCVTAADCPPGDDVCASACSSTR